MLRAFFSFVVCQNAMLVVLRCTYCHVVLLFVIVLSFTCCQRKAHRGQQQKDRVSLWLDQVATDTLDPLLRKEFLYRAYTWSTRIENDSLKQKKLSDIAYQAYQYGDVALFKKAGREALQLAVQRKDTLGMADAHWNYGAFYLGREVYDSAYYHYHKAQRLFETAPHSYYSGKMLYNMAVIQGRLKDYMACEVLLFRAIAILEPLNRHKQLYYCYNLLGVIYEELQEYQGAIRYHQKALNYLERVEDSQNLIPHSFNNIGILYQKQGNQSRAIAHFERAIGSPGLRSTDMALYARLLDNRAYSRLLAQDTSGLPRDFYTALQLRDSIGNQSGIIMSKQHLAEYYAVHRDTAQAMLFAKEALHLAQKLRNNRDILKTLVLLSSLDRASSITYLREYITLNKNIRDQERKVRDKFARVQYETGRYVERTQQLSSQKTWILIIGIGLLLMVSFLYIFFRQQAKTKMLHLETAQQKANEQVYLITLKQHERLQEVRNQERIRISQVLHGAIISELFAIRMNWGLLPLEGDPEAIQEHKKYLKKLKHLEREIREASHALMQKLVFYPLNLVRMVEKLTESRCKAIPLKPKVHNDENIPWNKVDLFIKTQLYHIIAEGLQNCIKHAEADRIEIHFVRQGRYIKLTIRDNGKGFRPHKRQKGIGLMHIQSRVYKLRGKFRVDTVIGQGTTLTVLVPAFKFYDEDDRKDK